MNKARKNTHHTHTDDSFFEHSQHENREFLRYLLDAKDITELAERVHNIVRGLSFSDYSFSRFKPKGATDFILTSMNKKLIDTYNEKAFYEDDMVFDYLATGALTPIFHSSIKEAINQAPLITHSLLRNREIINLYKKFGYEDAYLIPRQPHEGKGSILFTITTKNTRAEALQLTVKEKAPLLNLLAEAVHYIGVSRFPDHFLIKCKTPQEVSITPKPLRLLSLLAMEDLSLKEAADRLRITLDTANKHIAAAKNALGVRTQAGAVYRALTKGLI